MDDRRQERPQHILVHSGTADILRLMRGLLWERYTITINIVPDTFAQIAALDSALLLMNIAMGEQAGWQLFERLLRGSEKKRHPDAGHFYRTQLGRACPRAGVAARQSALSG